MEYKLELLQKRVNHLEDLIVTISEKIETVLDDLLSHHAKKAAAEESFSLSLLTKLKSIPEHVGTAVNSFASNQVQEQLTGNRQPRYQSPPPPVLTPETRQPETVSSPAPKKPNVTRPTRPRAKSGTNGNGNFSTRSKTRAQTQQQTEETSINESQTPDSAPGCSTNASAGVNAPAPVPSTERRQSTSRGVGGRVQTTTTTKTVEVITIDSEQEDEEEPEDQDEVPLATRRRQRQASTSEDDKSAVMRQINENHFHANENRNGDREEEPMEDQQDHEQVLRLLCEPEITIKTEPTTSTIPIKVKKSTRRSQRNEIQASNANSIGETSNSGSNTPPPQLQEEKQQEQEPQRPEDLGEELSDESDPNEEANVHAGSGEGTSLFPRKSISNYKRIRGFKSVHDGQIFMKVNGYTCKRHSPAAEGKYYVYYCKDKECSKLMRLLHNYENGRAILYEKQGLTHNHPPIRVTLPKPRLPRPEPAGGPPAPTFKLIQTFDTRSEAVALVQQQEPGAWILNQVVECSEDVKAYYNCGIQAGRTCPVVMILRTFNENGKVDQYVWQGEHVHDVAGEEGAAAVKSIAEYFTPPLITHANRNGRTYQRVADYATEAEAIAAIGTDEENKWETRQYKDTLEGKKIYLHCSYRRCSKSMILRGVTMTGRFYQYVSDGEHVHTLGPPIARRKRRTTRPPRVPRSGKTRTRIRPTEYAQVASFSSEVEARAHVRNEVAWSMRSAVQRSGFRKIYYGCRHDVKCPVRAFIRVEDETGRAVLFIASKEGHVHRAGVAKIRTRRPPLPKELKTVFEGLYAEGFTSAEKMLPELERRGSPTPAYHVIEYLARIKGRRVVGPRATRGLAARLARKKTILSRPGRVLSANPKNERKRKEKAAAAAAKRARASGVLNASTSASLLNTTSSNGRSSAQAHGSGPSTSSVPRRPSSASTTPSTSRASSTTTAAERTAASASTATATGLSTPTTLPSATPPQIKTEPSENESITASPYGKLFNRQAFIRLKRVDIESVEVIDL